MSTLQPADTSSPWLLGLRSLFTESESQELKALRSQSFQFAGLLGKDVCIDNLQSLLRQSLVSSLSYSAQLSSCSAQLLLSLWLSLGAKSG